jgi:hypothetical protein
MGDDWVEAIIGLFAIVVICVLIVFGCRMVDHHYQVSVCNGFGQATGREIKFVDYTFWNYECLTPSKDGKWVTTDQLREM